MEKKYCSTHSFYYTSNFCPFCLKDKSEQMHRRLVKVANPVSVSVEEQDREITEDDIAKLKAKFEGFKK